MQSIDWIILIAYLVFAFAVGLLSTSKAGKSIKSYFSADKSIPWWWLGISIIATTFAADTPLAITGITANDGISGNWLWWSWALTYVTVSIVFAARWRKSQVLTDVELIEIRYDGREAAILRGFKAWYLGVIVNCFILGWVMTAMTKITGPFVFWDEILGQSLFTSIQNAFPSWLLFQGDIHVTLTVIVVTVIVLLYSALGGIRGVILTDLFQFVIAMVTAVIFAWLAVDYVGGLEGLYGKMETIYGSEETQKMLNFLPGSSWMIPIHIFLIYVFVQWWARYDSDGTGYIAQRINTAKTAKDAQKGSLLFAISFIALRSWPWILIGLVSLVVYPLSGGTGLAEMHDIVANDREMGYPILMKLILPAGLLGLTLTSLIAAFMSTVDTHLNWGSSYLVNDFYLRFIEPNATKKRAVLISRISVVTMALVAIVVSSQMDSIKDAWIFFWNMSAGLGVAQLMRWLWWRSNAWTEITGMATALILTFSFQIILPKSSGEIGVYFKDLDGTVALLYIAVITSVLCTIVTLLTPPVTREKLEGFAKKTQPVGWWGNLNAGVNTKKATIRTAINWILGVTACYSALFSIGYLLQLQYLLAGVFGIAAIASLVVLLKRLDQSTLTLDEE